jgi:hypothetical protein
MRWILSALILLAGCASSAPPPEREIVYLPFLIPVPYPEIEVCECRDLEIADLEETTATSSEIIGGMMHAIIDLQECVEVCQQNERAVNIAREVIEEERQRALKELEQLNADPP